MAAVLALMLASVGMGVSALFTDQGTAVQAVDVGTFDFAFGSTTPGAQVVGDTVTCPAFHIESSYESDVAPHPTCNVTVSQLGTIDTAKVSVYLQVTGSADLSKFGVVGHGSSYFVMPPGHPSFYSLADFTGTPDVGGSAGMIGQSIGAMPASMDFEFQWPFPGLDNSDLGDSFTATFTLYVYE
jgi:hypothetical protein